MKTFLYFVGKPKDAALNAAAEDFIRRAARFSPCEQRETNPEKFAPRERHPSAKIVALDPAGRHFDTPAFVKLIEEGERYGRDLVFLIGGHDGLPPEWRRVADLTMSLSPMTFAHELARLMLAEQIYRGFATLRGHPYPR